MTKTCHYCVAKLWPTETSSLCCANGQVNLPPLQTLPEPLHPLFVEDTAESRCFRNNIRSYNSAFAFASLRVNEDMLPIGVYCFRVSSTVCYRIGHLQPNTNNNKRLHFPFTLTRRQFPIKPSYAMTINKSQGQTLTKVGIYLPQSVSFHSCSYV